MEKNLFENAKFGDKFITRDGRVATFEFLDSNGEYQLRQFDYERNFPFTVRCFGNGMLNSNYISNKDIISRYQEPIDEEELDKLAEENIPKFYDGDDEWIEPFTYGFKYGYKLAKGNKV